LELKLLLTVVPPGAELFQLPIASRLQLSALGTPEVELRLPLVIVSRLVPLLPLLVSVPRLKLVRRALSQPFALASTMMLCVTTRSNSSIDLRVAVLARRAEPRLRLIMLLTVSTCQRWP
jgi:hypothetical protein